MRIERNPARGEGIVTTVQLPVNKVVFLFCLACCLNADACCLLLVRMCA